MVATTQRLAGRPANDIHATLLPYTAAQDVLDLANGYAGQGRLDEASIMYIRLICEHPGTTAAGDAIRRLNTIGSPHDPT